MRKLVKKAILFISNICKFFREKRRHTLEVQSKEIHNEYEKGLLNVELNYLIVTQQSEIIPTSKDDIYGEFSINRIHESKNGKTFENYSTEEILSE